MTPQVQPFPAHPALYQHSTPWVARGTQEHPSRALLLRSPRALEDSFPSLSGLGGWNCRIFKLLPTQLCNSMEFAEALLCQQTCSQASWGRARHRQHPAQLSKHRARDSRHSHAVGSTDTLIQTRLPSGSSASQIPAVPGSQRLWLPPVLASLCAGDRLWRAPVLSLWW